MPRDLELGPPAGVVKDNRDLSEKPILYPVLGLEDQDICYICYAGMGFDGEPKWYVHHYVSGKVLRHPEKAFDSPEEALKSIQVKMAHPESEADYHQKKKSV